MNTKKIFQKTILVVAVVLTILSFSSINLSAQPNQHSNSSGSCSPALIKKAQHMIDQYRQNKKIPGISVALYDNGKSCILVSGTTGDAQNSPVTGETDFAMGSVEKVFSSTLLSIAIDREKAMINDHAAEYLVDENGNKVKKGVPFREVTLKELVTHTASLPRKIPGSKRTVGNNFFANHPVQSSTIQYLNSWHPPHPPGTQYKYSNLGFVLAGSIAEILLNKPYTKLLSKEITQPLGMTRTGLLCDPLGPGCAVGYNEDGKPSKEKAIGLWTTANDMLKFIEVNLGDLEGSPELSTALKNAHKELFRVDSVHTIGMGWERWNQGDSLIISKDGVDSGFGSWIGFEPKRQQGVTVLCNGGKDQTSGKLGRRLLELMHTMQ